MKEIKQVELWLDGWHWECPKKKCSPLAQHVRDEEIINNAGSAYVECENCGTLYKVNFCY